MKVVKRMLAVALVLVLVFSLTGCTEFEAKMVKTVNKMKKVNNLRADVVFYLDLSVKMLGQSLSDMEFGAEGTLDIDADHGTGFGKFHVTSVEEEQDVLLYYEKADKVVRTWTSEDDGKTWKFSETPLDQEGAGSGGLDFGSLSDLDKDQIAQLRTIAATFEEDGVTEIRGSESTVYRGTVSLKDLPQGVDLTGSLGQMTESTGITLTPEDIANIGDMPVAIAIDNSTGLISGFALDMTDTLQGFTSIAMDAYMAQMLGEQFEGLDLSKLGVTLHVDDCELECVMYDYDQVGNIVIPDNVRNNAVLADAA